jgi:hypothetical protein
MSRRERFAPTTAAPSRPSPTPSRGEAVDEAKVNAGASIRVQSADRLRGAVVTALGRLNEMLDAEQRAKLAYLIRRGTLSI